jgi:hypothetical protein
MDDSARDFFLKRKQTVTTIRRTGVFDQGICAKACREGDEVNKTLISLEIDLDLDQLLLSNDKSAMLSYR